jgi:hypothetical protein
MWPFPIRSAMLHVMGEQVTNNAQGQIISIKKATSTGAEVALLIKRNLFFYNLYRFIDMCRFYLQNVIPWR